MVKYPHRRWILWLCTLFLFPNLKAEEESLSGRIVVVKLRSDDFRESLRIREWEQLIKTAEANGSDASSSGGPDDKDDSETRK